MSIFNAITPGFILPRLKSVCRLTKGMVVGMETEDCIFYIKILNHDSKITLFISTNRAYDIEMYGETEFIITNIGNFITSDHYPLVGL